MVVEPWTRQASVLPSPSMWQYIFLLSDHPDPIFHPVCISFSQDHALCQALSFLSVCSPERQLAFNGLLEFLSRQHCLSGFLSTSTVEYCWRQKPSFWAIFILHIQPYKWRKSQKYHRLSSWAHCDETKEVLGHRCAETSLGHCLLQGGGEGFKKWESSFSN